MKSDLNKEISASLFEKLRVPLPEKTGASRGFFGRSETFPQSEGDKTFFYALGAFGMLALTGVLYMTALSKPVVSQPKKVETSPPDKVNLSKFEKAEKAARAAPPPPEVKSVHKKTEVFGPLPEPQDEAREAVKVKEADGVFTPLASLDLSSEEVEAFNRLYAGKTPPTQNALSEEELSANITDTFEEAYDTEEPSPAEKGGTETPPDFSFQESDALKNVNRYLESKKYAQAARSAVDVYNQTQLELDSPYNDFTAMKALDYAAEAWFGLEQYDDAIRGASLARERSVKLYGLASEQSAERTELLARYYEMNGQNERAMALREDVLAELKAKKALPPLKLAMKYNNLGEAYRGSRDFVKAENSLSLAVEIIETAYGSDYPDLAAPLNNLALAMKQNGKLTQSEAYLRRALQIVRKHKDADDPSAYKIYKNLYVLLKSVGRAKEADTAAKELTLK